MARYQILYWRYIPLGVKAMDLNGTVRKNLPRSFQETFQEAADHNRVKVNPYTTSGFRWAEEKEYDGTAAEVATFIVNYLVEHWNVEKSLATFESKKADFDDTFVDLKKL